MDSPHIRKVYHTRDRPIPGSKGIAGDSVAGRDRYDSLHDAFGSHTVCRWCDLGEEPDRGFVHSHNHHCCLNTRRYSLPNELRSQLNLSWQGYRRH